jgi:hypothetical protein
MKYWEIFWTVNLVVAGAAFAFITVVVTIKGVGDLRQWFGNLRRQNREESSTTGEGSL